MTYEQAIALADTRFWEEMTIEQRAAFQLSEERLCMPFPIFHEAVEKVLDRPVWTHEFADTLSLYRGTRLMPDLDLGGPRQGKRK